MIRLFELRSEKKLSQRNVASQLNITQATYHNWETGIMQPSLEQLIALSKLFGVSVDYMIGNSDDFGIIKTQQSLLPEQENLLNKFELLKPENKHALLSYLNYLLEHN